MYYEELGLSKEDTDLSHVVGSKVKFIFEGIEGYVTIEDFFERTSKTGINRRYVTLSYNDRKLNYILYNFFRCGIEKIVKPKIHPFKKGDIIDRYEVLDIVTEEKFNPDGTVRTRDWVKVICNDCHIVKHIRVDHFTKQSSYCYDCNNRERKLKKLNKMRSYGESIVEEVLKQQGIRYKPEKSFSWLPRRRYDFYLIDDDIVIEVHGIQHYEEQGAGRRFHNTLKHQQEVDKLKYDEATQRGLKYIEIDAREHFYEYIKNSIINSDIPTDKVDWSEVFLKTTDNSIIKSIIKGYNEGMTLKEISDITNINTSTISTRLEALQAEGFIEGYDKYEMSIRYHQKAIDNLLSKRANK